MYTKSVKTDYKFFDLKKTTYTTPSIPLARSCWASYLGSALIYLLLLLLLVQSLQPCNFSKLILFWCLFSSSFQLLSLLLYRKNITSSIDSVQCAVCTDINSLYLLNFNQLHPFSFYSKALCHSFRFLSTYFGVISSVLAALYIIN